MKFVIALLLLAACAKDNVPPPPEVTAFTVKSENILVEAQRLPGSTSSVIKTEADVTARVEMLDK